MYRKLSIIGFLLFFYFLAGTLQSQERITLLGEIEEHANACPPDISKSAENLAGYLTSPYDEAWEKTYAIYYWIATNIDYDLSKMKAKETYTSSEDLIKKALKKRSGICQHYAELFNFMCNQSGIQSLVVSGYTKQKGEVNDISHAWNATRIGDSWYLFDPTWAYGYIADNKVYKRYSTNHYMVRPEAMIKTHMPFDPIFQFLSNPITNHDFYNNNYQGDTTQNLDINHEITKYQNLSEIDQINSSLVRIKKCGIVNGMVLEEYNHKVQNLNTILKNQQVDVHNEAVEYFNSAIRLFNNYIRAKNGRFRRPKMSDGELSSLIEKVDLNANKAKLLFDQVRPSEEMILTLSENKEMVNELIRQLENETEFVRKYLNTPKIFRPALF